MLLDQNTPLSFFSLLRPITKPKIWLYLAYGNIVNEYRRTMLGPIWILLNLIIFVFAISIVYSGLFSMEYFTYTSYMATSMIAWIWASGILVNSGMVYITSSGILLDHPTDKAYLIWAHAMSQFIIFLHQLPFVLAFYLFGIIHLNLNMLYIIPSIILTFAINIGVAAILSIIVTRYRDLHKVITNLTVIIMVITPIFWKPEMVSGVRKLVYLLNPFYYFVDIIRDPLLGKYPGTVSYMAASFIATATLALGCFIHKKYSKFVVFRL